MQAAVAAYPQFGCASNRVPVKTEWGPSCQILSPTEETIQFCEDILTEVMELFPSEYIHIGGDEARKDLWEASPEIQQLREKRGLKNMDEMQAWFTRRINEFLNAHDRKLIGWDEICEGGLPPGAAVMWWRAKAKKEVEQAARNGHNIVIATYSYLYFDYYQTGKTSQEPLAMTGVLPLRKVYRYEPFAENWEKGSRHILGPQAQVWTEYIKTFKQVEYMAFPRACALAEIAWSPQGKKNYAGFLNRLKPQLERFDAAGVTYRVPDEFRKENKHE
jgi:hexosaminidase